MTKRYGYNLSISQELEINGLLRDGLQCKDIAKRMGVPYEPVRQYLYDSFQWDIHLANQRRIHMRRYMRRRREKERAARSYCPTCGQVVKEKKA